MIRFHFITNTTLKNRNRLKLFITENAKKERCHIESIDIIFCSDQFLLDINRRHLNHNFLTDIITFDLTHKSNKGKTAEIYISIDRVKENAQLFSFSFNQELHRVIFHGILHLCGYKDKKPGEVKMMRKMEDVWLDHYFR
ncbi:MAG: rRNA maturation RNase YbeY [Ferruginibacter sp.]|nr:rRNA maturation RNase YbeY [Ferruginibacter sp.]